MIVCYYYQLIMLYVCFNKMLKTPIHAWIHATAISARSTKLTWIVVLMKRRKVIKTQSSYSTIFRIVIRASVLKMVRLQYILLIFQQLYDNLNFQLFQLCLEYRFTSFLTAPQRKSNSNTAICPKEFRFMLETRQRMI